MDILAPGLVVQGLVGRLRVESQTWDQGVRNGDVHARFTREILEENVRRAKPASNGYVGGRIQSAGLAKAGKLFHLGFVPRVKVHPFAADKVVTEAVGGRLVNQANQSGILSSARGNGYNLLSHC